jgi:rod shape-determining protein MreC
MRRLTRRQQIAAMVLGVISLCFITLDLGGGGLRSAHDGVRGALGSLYRGTDAVFGPARRFVQGLPTAGTNQARIDALQRQNAQLRGELAGAAADRATATQLARLQLAADSTGYRVLPGRVIALGPGQGFDWTVTLDVGSTSGVRDGQSVTDGNGLVGRVLHTDSASCVVLLAADPGSGVGVRDVRTGEVGVATGRGANGFSFVPLSPTARLAVGDHLVTGPVGATSFVPGLAVGTVRAVQTSADGSTRADVTSAVSPTALDLVGVILLGGATPARAPLSPAAPVALSPAVPSAPGAPATSARPSPGTHR